jgi:hypothetical protein
MSLQAEISRSRQAQHSHVKQIKRKKTKAERGKRKAEIAAKRRARLAALPPILNDNMVLSFHEWIALNHLSEREGRRIFGTPNGPTLTQTSAKRFGVTVANNRAWQASRERS